MNTETIGNIAIGFIAPIVIFSLVVFAFLKTKQRHIANNAAGFLLIMLSIVMSGAPNFSAHGDIANNEIYKLIAVLAGLFGTAICAYVAFKDQANSKT
ncbi:hypothetical protein [Aeromonas rivuli]|jgi:hypothetical protein|uniref:hypothetical protein n=1 Tax=Aeromonas rivuli TaxID=648794 RepID=UPI001CCB726D|nr:hypothetical protein [Aeromonas rivuli]UBO72332.1 hypothetical protein KYK33_10480 [Aeromonas rivuli]